MKIKKTLYNWLTNRFLLIIRNEENFAEKRTFSFNYAKLIVFTISFLVLIFTLSFYLINTVLFSLLNPEYNEIETNKKIVFLTAQVDSLNSELRKKDIYGHNLYRILSGKPENNSEDSLKKKSRFLVSKKINLDSLSSEDLKLRQEIEGEGGVLFNINNSSSLKKSENYFLKPVEGLLLSKFDPQSQNFGVEIATKSGEIVKAIAEGVVIWANYSDEGYFIGIQHKNGFISVYKENSDVLKEAGEFVDEGEAIAVSGEKSNTAQPKVYFELWKEGIPLNPENYISF